MARKDTPLHPDLASKWGTLPYIQYHGGNEWSASCPACGESGHIGGDWPDRFRMFGPEPGRNARGWCRGCGHFEWADEGENYTSPSPEAIEAARQERERLAAENRERMRQKIQTLQEVAYWKGWHDAMTDDQRELWHQQGIIDYFIDMYDLGYRTDHTYYHDGREWRSPAMTIPHYDEGWELSNIQYRLTNPAPGAGKYRQTAGLPAAMFRTEPDETLSGAVLIVEGAKKAIVTYANLGSKPLGFRLQIVGVPSKTPSGSMLEELAKCEPVYLALDPDAYGPDGTARRVGAKLGSRVRYVQFPDKPDDLIVQWGLSGHDLKKYLRQATISA